MNVSKKNNLKCSICGKDVFTIKKLIRIHENVTPVLSNNNINILDTYSHIDVLECFNCGEIKIPEITSPPVNKTDLNVELYKDVIELLKDGEYE